MTSIFARDQIGADTDKAAADHAREPHELPRVGTMVIVEGFMTTWPAIVTAKGAEYAWALDVEQGDSLHDIWTPEVWTYATPEQRRAAWEGEK